MKNYQSIFAAILCFFLVSISSCTNDGEYLESNLVSSDETDAVPRLRNNGETTPPVVNPDFVNSIRTTTTYYYKCLCHGAKNDGQKMTVYWNCTWNLSKPPVPGVLFNPTYCSNMFYDEITSIKLDPVSGYYRPNNDSPNYGVYRVVVNYKYREINEWKNSIAYDRIGYNSTYGFIKIPDEINW